MHFEAEISFYAHAVRNRGSLSSLPSSISSVFGGSWKWGWVDIAAEDDKHVMGLVWDGAIDTVPRDQRKSPWRLVSIEGQFPQQCLRQLTHPPIETQTSCRVSLFLTLAEKPQPAEDASAERSMSEETPLSVARFAGFSLTPTPHDVLIKFPSGRQIWSSEALLRLSPYFTDLFSSGFIESTSSDKGATQKKKGKADFIEKAFEDSDDEVDSASPPIKGTFPAVPSFPFKTINVTEAAFSTYLALICYLQCGSINFNRLKSALPPATTTPKPKGRKRARASNAPAPAPLPLPVSPKSVYRLAHFLSLPALCMLALDNFRSQLTTSNATVELFDTFCSLYPEARDAVLDFVVSNKKEVLDDEVTKKKLEQLEGEDAEISAAESALLARLARRLMDSK
ncbi:hypothetical protein JCM11251_005472 [Rhodosporidiobolus azoricus]